MLTNKGKYGLKAMVHLAGLEPGHPALVADIADQNNIPKKFLDSILAELRNAGIVRSKKGRGGGYELARPASEIKVGQIVRVLDGPLAPIRCASPNYYERCLDCEVEKQCPVHIMMFEVRNAIARIMDNRTLAELRTAAGNDRRHPARTSDAGEASLRSRGRTSAKSDAPVTRGAAKAKPPAAKESKVGTRKSTPVRRRAV